MANDIYSDQDELSQFPSPVNPLETLGLDPDEVRANPDLLKGLGASDSSKYQPPTSGPVRPPSNGASAPTPEPSDPESYGMEGLGMLSKEMKSASKAAGEVPTTPPAELERLSAQRDKLSTPAPLYDTATGKRLDQTQEYNAATGKTESFNPKEGIGGKIWRGVRGGIFGLATGGIPGAIVGAVEPDKIAGGHAYNAPNKAYMQAEQRREQQLGATDTDLSNARSNWKGAVDASKAKAGEYRSNAALGKDLTTGATGLMNAANKPETENQKTDAKIKLTQAEFDQRRQNMMTDPNLKKLSPINRMLYMANGKVPDPQKPDEADVTAQQIARATTVFKLQHGGQEPQNLEDFNQIISAAKGTLGKADNKQDQIDAGNLRVAARSAERNLKNLTDMQKHSYLLPKEAKADLAQKIQDAQDEYDELQNKLTGDTKKTATATPAPSATPAPAAQPKSKPAPAPDGTRRQAPNGTIEVKQNGQWVPEARQ